ncbi:hypothetical protein V1525DRAFT_402347 [Lipomyces kononenkoae]|uniref:Uncharacterized protein n=1 Tax=Lipomyces kononenkoae TaxID=34357 RepID=A0ACC3T3F3_LIPKO
MAQVFAAGHEKQQPQVVYPHHAVNHHQAYHMPYANGSSGVVIPPGTYLPGTPLVVGSHNVTIERYLSEGGFAHVYVVRLDRKVNGTEAAVLKRVAVPDKESLGTLRTEVDTMRRLKGHRHVVSYIDSHASHLKSGGYEVFLLMEYCSGGGLIDLMNTRLQDRFTEAEILKIFSDIVEGVACMHYLEPPLIHRDLKVENVLISANGTCKVCDFGSSSVVTGPGMTGQECRMMEDDIQRHTTMQYRSPEMVDVYRRLPIDEKSDVWALGVLLYKLCYYTTPFEEQGQLAILNATFKFPPHPQYSERIKRLISVMLRENPRDRPNIYLVLKEVCSMRGVDVPIKDKYTHGHDEDRRRMPPPVAVTAKSHTPGSVNVIKSEKPIIQKQKIPEITPMRRGRLPPPSQQRMPNSIQQPSNTRPQPVHSDSESNQRPSYLPPPSPSPSPPATADIDDADAAISNRFPSIDIINLRPTPRRRPSQYSQDNSPDRSRRSFDQSRPSFESDRSLSGVSISSLKQPQPQRPVNVSTGSVVSPEIVQRREFSGSRHARSQSSYPVTTTDEILHSASISRPSSRADGVPIRAPSRGITPSWSRRPSAEINAASRSSSFLFPRRSPSASSNSGRGRPVSMFLDSSIDFLRSIGSRSGPASPTGSVHSTFESSLHPSATGEPHITTDHVESNVEFLKSLDTGGSRVSDFAPVSAAPPADGRIEQQGLGLGTTVYKHGKKPSLSAKLSGKFGDAFKKFEQQPAESERRAPSPDKKKDSFKLGRTSSGKFFRRNAFGGKRAQSPPDHLETKARVISVANTGTTATTASWEVKSDEVPSPVREAIERRVSSHDQKRDKEEPNEERAPRLPARPASDLPPATGTARPSIDTETTVNLADSASSVLPDKPSVPAKSPTMVAKPEPTVAVGHRRPRATSIQNRVQQLLAQSQSTPPRTASGYGHYTDNGELQGDSVAIGESPEQISDFHEEGSGSSKEFDEAKFLTDARQKTHYRSYSQIPRNSNSERSQSQSSERSKSHLPPHLRHGHASHKSDVGSIAMQGKPSPPPKPVQLQSASSPKRMQNPLMSLPSIQRRDSVGDSDWQVAFNKRYPSLSGLEQVEVKIRDMDLNTEGTDAGGSSPASSSRRRRVEGKA